jgi:hypothetical protein
MRACKQSLLPSVKRKDGENKFHNVSKFRTQKTDWDRLARQLCTVSATLSTWRPSIIEKYPATTYQNSGNTTTVIGQRYGLP